MSISTVSGTTTFTTTAASRAIARSEVTTSAPTEKVSIKFTITRRPLVLRAGTSAGGQELLADTVFDPGAHIVSFVPGVSPYYLEFSLHEIGKATLSGFGASGAGALQIDTPWTEEQLAGIRMAQSLNVVYITHPSHRPRVLERLGETSWSLREYAPRDGPFGPINTTNVTMTPAAQTGETTITASAPVFVVEDVGRLIRVTHSGQFETASLTALDQATSTIRVSGIGSSRAFRYTISGTFSGTWVLERAIGNEVDFEPVVTSTVAAPNVSFNDELDNQVVYYRIRCSAFTSGTLSASLTHSQGVTDGVARIVSVDADNEVTVDVYTAFSKTTATPLWYFGEWSDRTGWPAAVTFHDGRLSFVSADQYRLSVADNFESMNVGPQDSDAISRSLTGQMNAARWIKSVRNLIVGTSGSEHVITAGDLTEILTPATTFSRQIKTRGSAGADAVVFDNYIIFISRTRQRIYMLGDIDGGQSYSLMDLTRLHPDLAGPGGFRELAMQTEPWPRLWALGEDGVANCLLFLPEEEIAAWVRYPTPGGVIESVTAIPEGSQDGVYFSVYRAALNSNRYIEKLAPETYTTLAEACRLHCSGVQTNIGSPTASVTGAAHLNGATDVYAWADGRESGPYTVSGGGFTLAYAAERIIYGKKHEGRYKSGRLEWGARDGTSMTQSKRVENLGMLIYQTPGGQLQWGGDFQSMSVLPDVQAASQYDTSLVEITQDSIMAFEGVTAPDPRICISMPGAGPATVLAIAPLVATFERS